MKRFAVIGAGSFGFYVAKALFESNNEVIVIDRNKERVQAVDPHSTTAIVLDATDIEKLKGVGLEEMNAVIVSTGSIISTSILICFQLNKLGIKRIIVKAEDENHGQILRKLGASEIIRPGMDIAYRLSTRLTRPNILEYLPLEEEYTILQIEPPKRFIGKSLADLDLRNRYQVYVIAIKELVPERFNIVPPASFVIKDSDILIMIGKEKDVLKIRELQ